MNDRKKQSIDLFPLVVLYEINNKYLKRKLVF